MPLPAHAEEARATIMRHIGEIASATALFENVVNHILGIVVGDTRVVASLCSGWTVGRKLDKIHDVTKALPLFEKKRTEVEKFVSDSKSLMRERNSLLHNVVLTNLEGSSWSGMFIQRPLDEVSLQRLHNDIANLYVRGVTLSHDMLSGCSIEDKPRFSDFVIK